MKKTHLLKIVVVLTLALLAEPALAIYNPEAETQEAQGNKVRTLSAPLEASDAGNPQALGRARAAEARSNAQEKIRAVRENMEKRREAIEVRINARAYANIQAALDRTLNRLEGAIEKLSLLSERLESRLVKLEANGFNTEEARDNLATAQASIDASATAIENLILSTEAAVSTETPQEAATDARRAMNIARDEVKSAHTALVEAVSSARAAVTNPSEQSTDNATETEPQTPTEE